MRNALENVSDAALLRFCLGASGPLPLSQTEKAIIDHTILVTLDAEHWSVNTLEMTELGICTLSRQDVLPLGSNFGDHGENYLRAAKYYFFRVQEKLHLLKTNPNSQGEAGNHFGEARFVTFSDLRSILRDIFDQDIPGMPGCKKPVVLLGHAGAGDLKNIAEGKDISFDIFALGTVLRSINTQKLSQDLNFWLAKEGARLEHLVAKLNFTHADPHTAGNDSARTLMSAIYMTLPLAAHQNQPRSMQQVADDLETFTQTNFHAFGPGGGYGTPIYCWKCASLDHTTDDCIATGLSCTECISRGLFTDAGDHVALHCPTVAQEESEERRAWFRPQPKVTGRPKVPFKSRLTTFAPGAQVRVVSDGEVAARRASYDKQDPNATRTYWVSPQRSFAQYQEVQRRSGVW